MRTVALCLTILLLMPICMSAQSIEYIETNDTYNGHADIVAKTRVRMLPGFRAKTGCKVHIYTNNTNPPDANTYIPETGDISTFDDGVSNTYNYITTTTLCSAVSSEDDISETSRKIKVDYLDNFGNHQHTVLVKCSPNKKDIITDIKKYYMGDIVGKSYLPYESNFDNGESPTNIFDDCVEYYSNGSLVNVDNDDKPWMEYVYDGSPLCKNIAVKGYGSQWHEHPSQTIYKSNSDVITSWKCCVEASYSAVSYPIGSLDCVENIDEDGIKHEIYYDKIGRKIAQIEVGLDDIAYMTLYIYDDFNRLRCVVPPLASSPNDNLCFKYSYDKRDRVIEKHIPDYGLIRYVYDKKDRLVMSQDRNQFQSNEWAFFMYDELDRIVVEGFVQSSLNYSQIQSSFDNHTILDETYNAGSALYGYTGTSFPITISANNISHIIWYDNYDFLSLFDNNYRCPEYTANGKRTSADARVKGFVTGSLEITELDDNNSTIMHVNYYDSRRRLICTINDNHLGGKTYCFYDYNFSDDMIEQSILHKTTYHDTIKTVVRYEYDHAGRLIKEYFKLNNEDEFISKAYQYNAVGTLENIYLYSSDDGNTFQQKLKHRYNIKGWLTKVNDIFNPDYDLFAMSLLYNAAENNMSISPRYNGSIAMQCFGGRNTTPYSFNMTYKGLDWLHTSVYADGSGLNTNVNKFSETYDYAANGNITALVRRKNNIVIDDLVYDYYTGTNKIKFIEDRTSSPDGYYATSQNQYIYDHNGNIIIDPSKTTVTNYSRFNKPLDIIFSEDDRLSYYYTSTGDKLRTKVTSMSRPSNITIDYSCNFMYEDNELIAIFAPFGRIVPMNTSSGTEWNYHYHLTDHLGSVMVEFIAHDNSQPEVVQCNSYYPFGMTLSSENYNCGDENRHLFGGKELQYHTLAGISLNLYDFEARTYNPIIARFMQTDPMSEKYYGISSYSYCANNPIRYIDPDGRDPIYARNLNKSIDVTDNGDNTYTIVGGSIDNDRNVYVVDGYGNRTGEIIGRALTDYSFFSDDRVIVENAIINLNDNSGQDFFDIEIRYDNPNIIYYMLNGYGGKKYDFKHRGYTESMDKEIYYHRGMIFNGYIASGRDIGNVAAGFIAAKSGINWHSTRFAFDLLETIQYINNNRNLKFMTEGAASQSAQSIGFGYGLFINRN